MTRDDFEHKLDNNPEDWELRLIYADWLEEQGDNFAETQRWMAEHQKCAFQNKTVWHWWDEESATIAPAILKPGICQGGLAS